MRKDIQNRISRFTREERFLLNKSEMARRFNCDSRTIKRYLDIESGELVPKASRRQYVSKLDDYKEIIIDKVDKYGATAMAVYTFIRKKGYTGKYSTVAAFVKNHKQEETHKATVRFETAPGLQAQLDWKEELTMVSRYGEVFKINIFLMVLGYSRLKYICLTTNRNQNTLFSCMNKAFEYFKGIPHEILFDNMKTVVDHSKSSFTKTVLNSTFKHYSEDANFKTITCRPYRPQTKGKAEALARLMNRLVVYNEEFLDYYELEKIVEDFREEINTEVSQATNEVPFERFKKETEYLKPIPPNNLLSSYVSREKEYTVSKESMVRYEGQKYSVPTKYIGKKMTVTSMSDGSVTIYYNNDFVVCHSRSDKVYHYKKEHMQEILKSDACRHMGDMEIEHFINENMSMMDIYLGD